jgi:hypothetical protein
MGESAFHDNYVPAMISSSRLAHSASNPRTSSLIL